MCTNEYPTREELLGQLREAREEIEALKTQNTDAALHEKGYPSTRLRHADDSLRTSAVLLTQLMDASVIGIVLAEPDRIVESNDAFLDMVGYGHRDVENGLSWLNLTPTEYHSRSEKALTALRTHGRIEPFRKEFFHRDGSRVPALVGASLLSRDPFRWVAFVIDISAQERAERSLEQANQRLEEQVAQRTQELERRARQLRRLAEEVTIAEDQERERIANVLHDDLQQRLAGLKFILATLFRPGTKATEENIKTFADEIDACVAATRELSHELNPISLARRGLAVGIRWLADHMERTHGLSIRVEGDLGEEPTDPSVASVVFRAVRELLFNVYKHSGTELATVGLGSTDESVTVTVSDQGHGFDPQGLRDPTREVGLGLFGLEERVVSLGGYVQIRSNPGDGAEISVTVPLGKHPDPAETVGPGTSNEKNVARILLADDHEVMRRGLSALLAQQPSFQVLAEVANGREAVTAARELRPDIVIMDVSMPGMDGIEATRLIVQSSPHIKVVGLSMYDDPQMSKRMLEAGAVDYVRKTDPPEKLVQRLIELGVEQ